MTEEVQVPTPLLVPSAGLPEVIATEEAFSAAIAELAQGNGPFALDAERASGFKYSQRAYLIQLHRTNAPILLIDPIAVNSDDPEAFARLAKAIAGIPWILHAATQDIPCLAELGLRPSQLIDTELAGRFGYAFADVQPRFKRDPDNLKMNVTFVLREAPRVYVERVDINGNTLTQDKVIRREFRLAEGDAFNSIKVKPRWRR